MDLVDIEALAKEIAPGLVAEYGPHASAEMRACWIADYLLERGVQLSEGDADLLADEVRDLAKTA
ncbi:MAG TPA: hypothetical protein VN714_12780 [Trebonia sp.]|nr:hypothetical protein [Trebonia sp.]